MSQYRCSLDARSSYRLPTNMQAELACLAASPLCCCLLSALIGEGAAHNMGHY